MKEWACVEAIAVTTCNYEWACVKAMNVKLTAKAYIAPKCRVVQCRCNVGCGVPTGD